MEEVLKFQAVQAHWAAPVAAVHQEEEAALHRAVEAAHNFHFDPTKTAASCQVGQAAHPTAFPCDQCQVAAASLAGRYPVAPKAQCQVVAVVHCHRPSNCPAAAADHSTSSGPCPLVAAAALDWRQVVAAHPSAYQAAYPLVAAVPADLAAAEAALVATALPTAAFAGAPVE